VDDDGRYHSQSSGGGDGYGGGTGVFPPAPGAGGYSGGSGGYSGGGRSGGGYSGGGGAGGQGGGGSDPRSPFPAGGNAYYDEPGQRRRPPTAPGRRRLIDYPRYGRTGWKRWIPSWKLLAAICLSGIIVIIIGLFAAYQAISLPPPDQAALAQTSVVYYGGGKSVIGKLSTENRQSVSLSQVPVPVRQAVLAAEDRTFYTNSGVDPKSIVRAVVADVKGGNTQGGSTITQQYVKNVYNQRSETYTRKFKEFFQALKINKQVDKDQILERYLNTIYLGRGAYGIQAASQAYFGKDVSKLTVSQGAFLAGLINAPSAADPRDGAAEKARATFRWTTVLDAMVKYRWLNAADRAKLTALPKTVAEPKSASQKGQTGYLMEMATAEAAKDLGIPVDQLSSGGYKIVTTFDRSLVAQAVKSVDDKIPSSAPKNLRVGLVSLDPTTGAVKAIYGGTGVNKQLNQATRDTAQAGSTFKAFTLAAALEQGVSLKQVFNGASPLHIKGYPQGFTNFGNEQAGYVNLLTATAQSVNTVFLRLNEQIGAAKTEEAALAAGVPKAANVQDNLTNVLGTANPHTIDMASAYGTFANDGVHNDPYVVSSITDIQTGKQLYVTHPQGKRAFDKDVISDLDQALQQPIIGPGATGGYARSVDRPVAGKTGTSSNSNGAWFVGYTPNQLVTAVSMHYFKIGTKGKNKGKVIVTGIPSIGGVSNITGGTYPAEIWTEYMKVALDGQPVKQFPEPVDAGSTTPVWTPTTQHYQPTATATATATPTRTHTHNPIPTSTGTPSASNPGLPTFPGQPTATATKTRKPGDDSIGNSDP
jgi:membrane peptidoglycan carboxypeptidase